MYYRITLAVFLLVMPFVADAEEITLRAKILKVSTQGSGKTIKADVYETKRVEQFTLPARIRTALAPGMEVVVTCDETTGIVSSISVTKGDGDDKGIVVMAVNKKPGRRIVVSLGAQNYQSLGKLNASGLDAIRFGAALEKLEDLPTEVTVLTDVGRTPKPSNREVLLAGIEDVIAKLGSNDELICFFSGHGVIVDGKLYLAPAEFNLRRATDTGIAVSEIRELIGKKQARLTLLVIDACRSGHLKSGTRLSRAAGTDWVHALSGLKNLIVFASSESNQNSLEINGQGLYTKHFLKALTDPHVDTDKDGKIRASELMEYLSTRVKKASGGAQQPVSSAFSVVGDPVVFQASKSRQPDETMLTMGGRMHQIDPGEFWMGTADPARDFGGNELPQHHVTITKGYWIAETEVTQELWVTVMKTKPWSQQDFVKTGKQYPAVYIKWAEAVEFCERLSELDPNWNYRLPTEAEWEYAARAETKTEFSNGKNHLNIDGEVWYYENAALKGETHAHEVGLKKANPWGLHDIHGNVFEWTADGPRTYGVDPQEDPKGPDDMGSMKVIRSGSWNVDWAQCRSAYRRFVAESVTSCEIGLRLVAEPVVADN